MKDSIRILYSPIFHIIFGLREGREGGGGIWPLAIIDEERKIIGEEIQLRIS